MLPGPLAGVVDRAVGGSRIDGEAVVAVAVDGRADVEVDDLPRGNRPERRQRRTVDCRLRGPGDRRFAPGAVRDRVDAATGDAPRIGHARHLQPQVYAG